MWATIRGYLTFTRKERFGVLFLLLIISALFIVPYFFQSSVGDPDRAAYEKMKEGIQKFEAGTVDSSRESVPPARYGVHAQYKSGPFSKPAVNPLHAEMFYFDPNNLKEEEWIRLGLSERLAHTIQHYKEKGGRFRTSEDLKRLYGLQNSDYERLFPYVRIAKQSENIYVYSGDHARTNYNVTGIKKTDSFLRESIRPPENKIPVFYSRKNYGITDINQADSEGWSRLPGIGAKLASRIIHFREKLGGFYQVEQVGETFGLPDSVFRKIKPSLLISDSIIVQIDLNSATKEVLQAHPYIRWQMAKEIIEYRRQHGRFQSVEELLQLAPMDVTKFEKIKHYLLVKR